MKDARQVYELGTERREAVAVKQYPYCSILSCADSRVPPEHLFHAGIGDLFTVRVAGNVAEPSAVGSLEYAAEHLGSQLIVVMGHERCGAVSAAATATSSLGPNLDTLLSYIKPHIRATDSLDTSIYANIRAQAHALLSSDILAHLVHEGKLQIVAARYDLDSGQVEFLPEAAVADATHAIHSTVPTDATHSNTAHKKAEPTTKKLTPAKPKKAATDPHAKPAHDDHGHH